MDSKQREQLGRATRLALDWAFLRWALPPWGLATLALSPLLLLAALQCAGVGVEWAFGLYDRRPVAIGSPEEADLKAHLALLGPDQLAKYEQRARWSSEAGLSTAWVSENGARDFVSGGPPNAAALAQALGAAGSGASTEERLRELGRAWLASQRRAERAFGPASHCGYWANLRASTPWADATAQAGSCQAATYQAKGIHAALGVLALLVAVVLRACPLLPEWTAPWGLGTLGERRREWLRERGEEELARLEGRRIRLSMALSRPWRRAKARGLRRIARL